MIINGVLKVIIEEQYCLIVIGRGVQTKFKYEKERYWHVIFKIGDIVLEQAIEIVDSISFKAPLFRIDIKIPCGCTICFG